MKLGDYFEKKRGIGVLATANASGEVAIALYARPHAAGGRTIEFIMADRLSRRNLAKSARGLSVRGTGDGYRGRRLYLTKTGEEGWRPDRRAPEDPFGRAAPVVRAAFPCFVPGRRGAAARRPAIRRVSARGGQGKDVHDGGR